MLKKNDINKYTNTSVHKCKEYCDKDVNCQGFTWSTRSGGECFTKPTSCNKEYTNDPTPDPKDYNFYEKIGKPDKYIRLESDCIGNNLNNYGNMSLTECKSNCDMDSNCKGISYNIKNRNCITKSKTCDHNPSQSQALTDDTYNFYEKKNGDDCNQNGLSNYKHILPKYRKLASDCSGNNLNVYTNATLQQCTAYCDADDNCKGISFLPDSRCSSSTKDDTMEKCMTLQKTLQPVPNYNFPNNLNPLNNLNSLNTLNPVNSLNALNTLNALNNAANYFNPFR